MNVHRQREEKKAGSALLVVLGFLSFMVVSAVAFAIYMRAERVPSSALRRNAATRHLVKAAMAHAMSRVDDAIRNDPFPGLARTNDLPRCYCDNITDENAMDVWYGRVFMPPNPEGLVDDKGRAVRRANDPTQTDFAWRFAPVTETVSVLNLEALGYLPPPLVNDVRFLSRSTWTAKWQNFLYDAGRFAFCAVNVSDYFDINRTGAGTRSSPLAAPISLLGPVSWKGEGNNPEDIDPSALAAVIGPDANRQTYSNPDPGSGSSVASTTPYVSMLDYNLAIGSQGTPLLTSYFYEWIDKGNKTRFYDGTTESTTSKAARQPFITDSFATNETYEIDFAKLEGQPFYGVNMSGNVSMMDVAKATSAKFINKLYNNGMMGKIDTYTLYDYLDHDDVPITLAMPSVECVPMVTAVELMGGNFCMLKVNAPPTPRVGAPPLGTAGTKTTTKEYTLDPTSFNAVAAGVRVLVTFPFRHFAGRADLSRFKAQVVMKVFVADATGVSARPSGPGIAALRPKDKAEWSQPCKAFEVDGANDALVFSLCSQKVSIPMPATCDTQDDAVPNPIEFRAKWDGAISIPANQVFFTTKEEQPVNAAGADSGPAKSSFQFNLRPFIGGNLAPAGMLDGTVSSVCPAGTQFRVYAALWVRITDSSGEETYDLAPACVLDDELNGQNNNSAIAGNILGGGFNAPACLLFTDASGTVYSYDDTSGAVGFSGASPTWQEPALATVDPRYNYAPEDWFVWNKQNFSGGDWLDEIQNTGYKYFGSENDRDPDIFMFASNQGYLQSLGEFAFLPRLSNLQGSGSAANLFALTPSAGDATAVKYADSPERIMNNVCAWRTYLVDHAFYEDCAKIGVGRNTNGILGVNPYSDNNIVRLAAFADTPCDYWTVGRIVAGAGARNEELPKDFKAIVNKLGDESGDSGEKLGKVSECRKYAFCEVNKETSSRMKVQEMSAISRYISSRMRESAHVSSWEKAYDDVFAGQLDDLDPQNDSSAKVFMGQPLDNCYLYSIDRKFLYSYWRDCFANKQQLFLIFVRAESSALGGPGEGTPSQQGGRAVALVWREPTAYNDGNNPQNGYTDNTASQQQQKSYVVGRRPHRMRVLFYHQFD